MRAARHHHEDMLQNKKKEITQRLELDLQRKVNGAQATHYDALRRATETHKEKHELIKNAELRQIQNKISSEFNNNL